jgi:hypothetical protein
MNSIGIIKANIPEAETEPKTVSADRPQYKSSLGFRSTALPD